MQVGVYLEGMDFINLRGFFDVFYRDEISNLSDGWLCFFDCNFGDRLGFEQICKVDFLVEWFSFFFDFFIDRLYNLFCYINRSALLLIFDIP